MDCYRYQQGGQTALLYRTFYPDDVDVSVPYVSLCYGTEDGRHEPFLKKCLRMKTVKRITDFQLKS